MDYMEWCRDVNREGLTLLLILGVGRGSRVGCRCPLGPECITCLPLAYLSRKKSETCWFSNINSQKCNVQTWNLERWWVYSQLINTLLVSSTFHKSTGIYYFFDGKTTFTHRTCNLKQKLKELKNLLCIDYEINCISTLGIQSFGETYYSVGGINVPKKISCICTDGVERPQLVKVIIRKKPLTMYFLGNQPHQMCN